MTTVLDGWWFRWFAERGADAVSVRDITAAVMEAGEIPARDPDPMALAITAILVQPATGRLYGRLTGGLTERADEAIAMAWRALS